jgi:hypothetical protein
MPRDNSAQAVGGGDEPEVLPDRQAVEQLRIVGDVAQNGLGGNGVLGDVVAVEEKVAASGGEDAGQGAQGRRLAGAVGAKQAEDLAGRHGEGNAGDRHGAIVRLVEVFDDDGHESTPARDPADPNPGGSILAAGGIGATGELFLMPPAIQDHVVRSGSDPGQDEGFQRKRPDIVADQFGVPFAAAAGALEDDLVRGGRGGAPGLAVAARQQAPRPVTAGVRTGHHVVRQHVRPPEVRRVRGKDETSIPAAV